ncbi:sensor histidine kinase [Xanthovirga aplysinae]|uniref:sensor histidine kinase n=1 Tax=Xanthovirga aplysinae TaxID=2529853 RepID=UPI0012BD6F40|nr:HAMP domain-containing sensor histidine kinase [Xanthovirga aplysinae]MTI33117.1 HAMP domain-containing histidine kinase [Xanthovirga aplysinae]
MRYKNPNSGLLIRLAVFALLVASFALAVYEQSWFYSIHAFVFIVLSVWNFVHYINGLNRKLNFFFEAIANGESSIHFSETIKNKPLRNLHKNLNRVNNMISELKISRANREQLFMEYMRQSETGFIVVEESGKIDTINAKALEFLDLNHLSHIQSLARKNKPLFETISQLKAGKSQVLKWLKNQQIRQVSIKKVVIHFESKKYEICFIYDIRKELEENELEAWMKFIRISTHEIMNSIAPITSLSNTLSRFFVQNGENKSLNELNQKSIDDTVKGLSVIEDRSEGLMHFVENYRKLSKIPEPVFRMINVADWLHSIELLFLKQMKEENISFDIFCQYERAGFPGDEKLLSQVLINLLKNSIEALKERNNKKISIYLSEDQVERVKIAVKDNGKGFQPDELESIFIPFFTTKPNGSGIGLSLSRQIMRLHKGSLLGRSIPGEETTFELVF